MINCTTFFLFLYLSVFISGMSFSWHKCHRYFHPIFIKNQFVHYHLPAPQQFYNIHFSFSPLKLPFSSTTSLSAFTSYIVKLQMSRVTPCTYKISCLFRFLPHIPFGSQTYNIYIFTNGNRRKQYTRKAICGRLSLNDNRMQGIEFRALISFLSAVYYLP